MFQKYVSFIAWFVGPSSAKSLATDSNRGAEYAKQRAVQFEGYVNEVKDNIEKLKKNKRDI